MSNSGLLWQKYIGLSKIDGTRQLQAQHVKNVSSKFYDYLLSQGDE